MSRSIKDILKDIVIRNTPFTNRLEICVLDGKDKRIIKECITLDEARANEMAIALMEHMMVDNEGWIKVNNHETITTYNFSKTVEAEAKLKELREKEECR